MMNVCFVPPIGIHISIILIFIEKKVCLSIFFPRKIFFPVIFDFHSARTLVSETNSRL